MNDVLPDEFLRGVSNSNQDYITAEGYPTKAVFQFDEYDPNARSDGFCELSINWVDDEGAVDTIMNQINMRKNCLQFLGGYCRLKRSVLIPAMKSYIDNDHIKFERAPIAGSADNGYIDNPYHGNILMDNSISKQAKINIQASLACLAGIAVRRK